MIGRRGEYCTHSSSKNALKRKRTKTYGLAFSQRSLGRVGRTPALPTDQPLRGSWRNIPQMYINYDELFLYRTDI